MSATGSALVAALGLCALAAGAALALPRRPRPMAVGLLTVGAGLAGLAAGASALAGRAWGAWLPGLLPLSGVRLAVDPLSGIFLAVTGAVAAAVAVYGIGYTRHDGDGRLMQAALPLFVASMLAVPAAASVSTFLLAWELMALTSLLLVLGGHRRRSETTRSGLWYAVMTHLSLVAIMAGLAVFAAAAHGQSFAALRAAAPSLAPAVRATVFLTTLAGFAAKAGVVPLHAWLPRAHPEAPSHVSALMSAAMVSLGAYGLIRVGFVLLRGGPAWWWLTVLAAGAASALYGVLQSAVATDLKRLLAYSTCENMGLVLMGAGAAGFFAAVGAPALAALALAAALLHVANHAAFKTLLFLGAGSVLHATGARDLDALGGLRSVMPATTAMFAAGALAASALPPGNGFVSEWLLLQSLIHAVPAGGAVAAVAMPLAVAVIALSAGLGVAAYVKAFGIGFLARPRGAGARRARESGPAMLTGMALAGAACLALALAPGLLAPGLARAVTAAASGLPAAPGAAGAAAGGGPPVAGLLGLRLSGVASTISPLLIAVALIAALAGVAALARLAPGRRAQSPASAPAAPSAAAVAGSTVGGARPAAVRGGRVPARLWDCGAGPMTARMEYTATSFAEPLQRVFGQIVDHRAGVEVTSLAGSDYLMGRVAYRSRSGDRIERWLYDPVLAAMAWYGRAASRLANGSVHRYLGYGFAAFAAILVMAAVLR